MSVTGALPVTCAAPYTPSPLVVPLLVCLEVHLPRTVMPSAPWPGSGRCPDRFLGGWSPGWRGRNHGSHEGLAQNMAEEWARVGWFRVLETVQWNVYSILKVSASSGHVGGGVIRGPEKAPSGAPVEWHVRAGWESKQNNRPQCPHWGPLFLSHRRHRTWMPVSRTTSPRFRIF